jgi:hypothetical protein
LPTSEEAYCQVVAKCQQLPSEGQAEEATAAQTALQKQTCFFCF